MSKKFQLQIPEPCHENWDKMTPVDKGRFCDSCQKAVVDFTGMSDSQLVAFFKKPSTGSVCGRFYNDQLERDIDIPRKRLPWLKYFFQFTIPVFLTTLKIQSQENKLLKERLTPNTSTTCDRIVYATAGMVSYSQESRKIIGIVTGDKGKGIPYASIYLKGTTKGVTCDSTGFFKIEVPQNENKIALIASSVGYLEKEKEMNIRKSNFIEIKLTTNAALSGEVVVITMGYTRKRLSTNGAISVKKESYLKRIKECFIKDSVNIFPNPVKAGNEIRIEWKKADPGIYNIDLFNLQGQLIHSATTDIFSEKNIVTYRLPMITAGSYILRLTNKNTGKRHSEKIIIQ
jgi:hypothetical protein